MPGATGSTWAGRHLQHDEIAALAFGALGRSPRGTHLPDVLRWVALALLPVAAALRIDGLDRFFLTAMGLDMVDVRRGSHHLIDHFTGVAQNDAQPESEI